MLLPVRHSVSLATEADNQILMQELRIERINPVSLIWLRDRVGDVNSIPKAVQRAAQNVATLDLI